MCGGERGRESARTCRAGFLHPHPGPGACQAPAAHLCGPCRHLPPWSPGLAPRGARPRPPPHSAAASRPLGRVGSGGPRRALVSPQGGPAGPGLPSCPGHPRSTRGRECLRPSSAAPGAACGDGSLRGQRRPSRGRRGERSEPALRLWPPPLAVRARCPGRRTCPLTYTLWWSEGLLVGSRAFTATGTKMWTAGLAFVPSEPRAGLGQAPCIGAPPPTLN